MNSLSISGKNWILKKYDQKNLLFIKENFFLDEITSKLLTIRQIKKEEINSFLNPSIKSFLPNPNNLIDMEKSSLRTLKSISNNEKIGIFGDYDVDGATSTALLGNYFSELNLNKISNNRENLNLKNYVDINEMPLLKNDTNKAIEFSSNFENTNERKYKRNFWELFD